MARAHSHRATICSSPSWWRRRIASHSAAGWFSTGTAVGILRAAIGVLRLRRRSAACAQDDNRRSLRSARDDSTKEEQNGKGSMLFTWSLYLCRRRPTLPHTFACSTIGPAGLNFRVRDGNGCFPRGKITGNLRRFAGPGLKPRNLVGPLDRHG